MAGNFDPLWWLKEIESEKAQQGYEAWLLDNRPPELPPTKQDEKPAPARPGGGGGGAAANPGLSPYIQDYRLNFFPTGDPPADLLKKAKENNWSIAYWRMQIRRQDPKYWRSVEAKKLLPEFNRTMKILFPGLADKTRQKQLMQSKFYKQQAMWYLKNGIGLSGAAGAEMLYGHITQTKRWNENNPYWRAYARNANIGTVAEANPMLYKQYLETVKQSYKQLGIEAPDDYYRTFFKSRYASKEGMQEFGQNLALQFQAGNSMGWWQGQAMNQQQVKTATMGEGKAGQDLRQRLGKAFTVRSSFLSGQQKGFETGMSKSGDLVKPLI